MSSPSIHKNCVLLRNKSYGGDYVSAWSDAHLGVGMDDLMEEIVGAVMLVVVGLGTQKYQSTDH